MKLKTWAKRHYWDSLEKDKDIIIRHLRTFDDSDDDTFDIMHKALQHTYTVLFNLKIRNGELTQQQNLLQIEVGEALAKAEGK